ncbi:MAG: NYN domain-containing protein [Candidatus Eisenbacteria bacterium]|nr:NYN domain-containing protein [Candidatus Eisenbacteria bacterium]
MPTEDRRLWLIDAGYLFNAQRSLGNRFLFDYLKLRTKVETFGPLWRAYYLNSVPQPPTEKQNAFHAFLQSGPPRGPKIITKLYGLKNTTVDRAYCEECGSKVKLVCPHDPGHRLSNQEQKGVDVGIATLALTHRDHYDTLVLSSGDADLLDAIEYLTEVGKRFELVVFKENVSPDMQARADAIHWIDDFAADVRRDKYFYDDGE